MERDLDQQAAGNSTPVATTPEVDNQAAEGLLLLARSYRDALKAALASGDVSGAKAAISALQMIVIPLNSPVAGDISEAKAAAAAGTSMLDSVEQDNEVDHAAETGGGRSSYCRKGTQKMIMGKMSAEVQDYFNKELKEDSYKAVEVTKERVDGRDVLVTKPANDLTGDQVREAFTDVNAHGAKGEERKAIREKMGQGEDMTPKEVEDLKTSLKDLEKYKASKIMSGPGTDEEKAAKIEKMHERFEKAKLRVDEAHQAEKGEQKAIEQGAPEPMRKALRQHKHDRRDALSTELKEGVINEAVMDKKADRSHEQQHDHGHSVAQQSGPLNTPGMKRSNETAIS